MTDANMSRDCSCMSVGWYNMGMREETEVHVISRLACSGMWRHPELTFLLGEKLQLRVQNAASVENCTTCELLASV
jgi:hypothetical protein